MSRSTFVLFSARKGTPLNTTSRSSIVGHGPRLPFFTRHCSLYSRCCSDAYSTASSMNFRSNVPHGTARLLYKRRIMNFLMAHLLRSSRHASQMLNPSVSGPVSIRFPCSSCSGVRRQSRHLHTSRSHGTGSSRANTLHVTLVISYFLPLLTSPDAFALPRQAGEERAPPVPL